MGADRLSESDLGARMSLLFRIHDDPDHPFSEVVGVLQRIDRPTESEGAVVRILRRNGDLAAVPVDDVIRFKILDGR